MASSLTNVLNKRQKTLEKPKIQSSSTIYNRMKATNKRHHQAKAHIGKGKFCMRKAPKAEQNEYMKGIKELMLKVQ